MRVLLRGVENIVDILAAAVKVHLIGLHSHVGDGGKTIAGGQLIALGRDAAKLQCVAYGGQHVVQLHVGYLDTEYDLSKVLFIATANNIGNINPALRDRMEMINIPGYILEEKVRIGLDHLLPKQMTAHGIPEGQLVLTPEVVEQVIAGYTRESGVRSLDKHLAKIARYRAKQIAFEEAYTPELTQADVEKILGIPKFLREEYEVGDMVGVVTGLAWTEVGGDILYIESVLTPGKGKVSLTGNLGEVMKESATIAHEWVMAHHKELGIDPEMFEKNDINIHVPEVEKKSQIKLSSKS